MAMSNIAEPKIADTTVTHLPNLHAGIKLPYPKYDRRKITEGIVHIGIGGFHRAHQALYAEELIRQHDIHQWGICGVGIMPSDLQLHQALNQQSCLYTLVQRDNDGFSGNIIGSLTSYLFGYQDPQSVFAKLAAPQCKLVTLTATEGGYYFHQGIGELDLLHPAIQHDLQHPLQPRTIFGYLTQALKLRRMASTEPFTILSCDNLQENGNKTKRLLLAFCAETDPELARWIEQNVAFPNCMVDRITSITTDADRQLVRQQLAIQDAAPVMAEPFRQWIIEDNFCNQRPPFDLVGAQFTTNVEPYEKMKLRLLNAGHSALGYLGYLAGFRFIHDIALDREFAQYLMQLFELEISPLLLELPGIDLTSYKQTLIKRFTNAAINDQALRICMHGSAKMPVFILPSIVEQLQRGGEINGLSLCVASWLRFLGGIDDEGREIPIDDPMAEKLTVHVKDGKIDPLAVLNMSEIFGTLGQQPKFVEQVCYYLELLYNQGARAALQQCID